MTSTFGLLGFRPEERYRTIGEDRILAMVALLGWPISPNSAEAREGASQALETWIRDGLPFRRAENGSRLFDPIEVYNTLKRPGPDTFLVRHHTSSLQRLSNDLESAPNHFTVHSQRTFHLATLATGSKLRLRLPLPLSGDHLSNLSITPDEAPAEAQLQVTSGRMEARLVHDGRPQVTLGAEFQFTAHSGHPAGGTSEAAPDPIYLAPREGFIVVTERIRRLAEQLAPVGTPPREAVRAFWTYLMENLCSGLIHYDQVDPGSPGDWLLDAGWFDCQLGSALLVALCRARGIPARMIAGHFLFPSMATNHFWFEAWFDDAGWTPFDTLGWDISGGGQAGEWRDRYFGRLEPRLIIERLPREFLGPTGIPFPRHWYMLQSARADGVEILFTDGHGRPLYADRIRVGPARAKH